MPLLLKQATFLMAFLALMVAQAYGADRGYASHHGISLIACDAEHAFGEAENAARTEDDAGSENHAPITVDMETRHLDAAAAVHVEFSPVQVAEISVWDWILQQQMAEADLRHNAAALGSLAVFPPPEIELVRIVVMLI